MLHDATLDTEVLYGATPDVSPPPFDPSRSSSPIDLEVLPELSWRREEDFFSRLVFVLPLFGLSVRFLEGLCEDFALLFEPSRREFGFAFEARLDVLLSQRWFIQSLLIIIITNISRVPSLTRAHSALQLMNYLRLQ